MLLHGYITWLFSLHFVDLVQCTTLFREAAGVYHHLAHEVLPVLQPSLGVERPPELVASLSSVMRLICLADAQVSILVVTGLWFYNDCSIYEIILSKTSFLFFLLGLFALYESILVHFISMLYCVTC